MFWKYIIKQLIFAKSWFNMQKVNYFISIILYFIIQMINKIKIILCKISQYIDLNLAWISMEKLKIILYSNSSYNKYVPYKLHFEIKLILYRNFKFSTTFFI